MYRLCTIYFTYLLLPEDLITLAKWAADKRMGGELDKYVYVSLYISKVSNEFTDNFY